MTFAKSRMDHDVDHFVLFQILLSHALNARSTVRLSQIWEVMPHGFGIFDLLALVRHELIEGSEEETTGITKCVDIISHNVDTLLLHAEVVGSIPADPLCFFFCFANLFYYLSVLLLLLISGRKVMADEDEEILMIEVFRPQLLKMWSASKHGDTDKVCQPSSPLNFLCLPRPLSLLHFFSLFC